MQGIGVVGTFQDRDQAVRDRLDRGEGVVDLMAQHADEPLPRHSLFLAKHLAQVGKRHELMRSPILPEWTPADLPPTQPAGERHVHDARGLAGEAGREPRASALLPIASFSGFASNSSRPGSSGAAGPFSSKANRATSITARTRPSRFAASSASQPLLLERLTQRVDLRENQPQRIAAIRDTGTQRVVTFAQRRQEVGYRVEWTDEAIAEHHEEAHPYENDEHAERPLGATGVVSGPQQHERHRDRRKTRQECE